MSTKKLADDYLNNRLDKSYYDIYLSLKNDHSVAIANQFAQDVISASNKNHGSILFK